MQKYIITQEYYDQFESILTDSEFPVGTVVTQSEDGTLAKTEGDPGGPVNPPPIPPKI